MTSNLPIPAATNELLPAAGPRDHCRHPDSTLPAFGRFAGVPGKCPGQQYEHEPGAWACEANTPCGHARSTKKATHNPGLGHSAVPNMQPSNRSTSSWHQHRKHRSTGHDQRPHTNQQVDHESISAQEPAVLCSAITGKEIGSGIPRDSTNLLQWLTRLYNQFQAHAPHRTDMAYSGISQCPP